MFVLKTVYYTSSYTYEPYKILIKYKEFFRIVFMLFFITLKTAQYYVNTKTILILIHYNSYQSYMCTFLSTLKLLKIETTIFLVMIKNCMLK